MSLVKPPDPEKLQGLSLKEQRDFMAQWAESTLSQLSRSSSTESSQTEETRKGILKMAELEDSLPAGKEVKSILKSERQESPEHEVHVKSILKTSPQQVTPASQPTPLDAETAKPHGILKRDHGQAPSPLRETDTRRHGILRKDTVQPSQKSEAKGILKKDPSHESPVLPDPGAVRGVLKRDGEEASPRGALRKTSVPKVDSVFEEMPVVEQDQSCVVDTQRTDAVPKGVLKVKQVESVQTVRTTTLLPISQVKGILKEPKFEVEVGVAEPHGILKVTPDSTGSPVSAASNLTETKVTVNGETVKSADMTTSVPSQPVNSQQNGAEENGEMSTPVRNSTIADRMQLLQKSGEEAWKRRVNKSNSIDNVAESPSFDISVVKLREKSGPKAERPSSIADRLSKLEGSMDNWRDRLEEKDVKQFTVEGKMSMAGMSPHADSPLMQRKKRIFRAPLNRDSESPTESSDSSQPASLIKTPSSKSPFISTPKGTPAWKTTTTVPTASAPTFPVLHDSDSDDEEQKSNKLVDVLKLDDENFRTFFKQGSLDEITAQKVDVNVDDFDHIFMESQDILTVTKKVKPQQRKAPASRNPMKALAARQDIQQTYTEVKTDVAEREMKRIKMEQIAGSAVYAQEALAGLASKENFSKVTLRKTDSFGSSTPGSSGRYDPHKDLMLLQVKGRRHCQIRLVEPTALSINSGDCFLLVTPEKVYVWVGEYSNVIEKAKAAEVASVIVQKRDLGCKNAQEAINISELKQTGATKRFWEALGGFQKYMECGPNEEDELYEMYMAETNRVYHLVDDKLVLIPEYSNCVSRHEMLNSKLIMVFDFGSEMYIWTGKQAPFNQRKVALKLARELWDSGYDYQDSDINPMCPLRTPENGGLSLSGGQRPEWCLLGKVNENMETVLFREKFMDWPDTSRLIKTKGQDKETEKTESAPLVSYDATKMITIDKRPVTLLLEGSNVGRGKYWTENHEGLHREYEILTMNVKMWHVLEYDHFLLEEQHHGQFHEGDTYVVRWHYMIAQIGMKDLKGRASARHSMTGRERCAYFFWQGRNSSITEKGASALMTVELDEERGPQVRVIQGKEPPCFVNLFKKRMIVHIGKREEEETNTVGPYRLYQVRNELENEAYLTEVECKMASLRSRTSYLLLNVDIGRIQVWHGSKSPKHTRQRAMECANQLSESCPPEVGVKENAKITVLEMTEGSENKDFWAALDSRDRTVYYSLLNERRMYNFTARLFDMTSVSGTFQAIEVLNPSRNFDLCSPFPFFQSDLYKRSQPALLLLDVEKEVYLWQGWWPQSTEDTENVKTGSANARLNIDRRCAMETTLQYCKEKDSSSPPPAYLVYAGVEPVEFTNFFPVWEHNEEATESNILDGKRPGEKFLIEEILERLNKTQYTWSELQQRPLPEGVDPLKLEAYLEAKEFQNVVGMSRDEFYGMPSWKQAKVKKEVGLF